jgi:hypothetical protein
MLKQDPEVRSFLSESEIETVLDAHDYTGDAALRTRLVIEEVQAVLSR